MFHAFGRAETQAGDSLANWQVEVVALADSSTVIPIFADENGTPIETVSGVENRALADEVGNYDFFVPSGTYSLRFYDANGEFQKPQRYLPMYGDIAEESLTALTAIQTDVTTKANQVTTDAAQVTIDASNTASDRVLAQTAANQATTAGNTFDDTTAGIAGTVSGEYFTIPSASGDGYLDLYKNNAGTPVFQKTYPGLQALRGTTLLKHGIDWFEEIAGALNVGIYDAQNLGTLWQDEAGTVPVTAIGQTVLRIDDVSGSGLHIRSFGSGTATLQQHANGAYFVDCPVGSRFYTQDGVFSPNLITMTPPVFIGAAIARGSVTSQGMIGFGAGNANSIQLKAVNNQQAINATIGRTDRTNMVELYRGRIADEEPAVLDAYLDAEYFTTWQNGGNATMPRDQFAGGRRSLPTTWQPGDTIADARWGINTNGGATTGDTHFYGAVFVNGLTISPGLRQRITEWLKSRARLDTLDAYEYDAFAFIGDSIMDGLGDRLLSTPPEFGRAVEYVDSNNLRPLIDPTQGLEFINGKGSLKPAFAKQWFAETSRRVCVIGCSMSGEGILGHSATYDGYTATGKLVGYTADKIESAMHLLASKRGARFRGFVCLLGSNDAPTASGTGYTSAQYEAEIVALLDRLRKATGYSKAPLFLISPDRRTDGANDAGFTIIRQAHIDAAANNPDIHLVNPYQDYAATGDFVDVIHWGQNNLNDAGTRAATNTAAALGMQLP